jgi:hypothetical protein
MMSRRENGCVLIAKIIMLIETTTRLKNTLFDSTEIQVIICGTQCDDVANINKKTLLYGKQFASDNGHLHFETSAKNNTNVQELFLEAASMMVKKFENNGPVTGIKRWG